MPACGACSVRYGGHTTCFSVDTDDGMLIFDAGNGISHINADLAERGNIPPTTILFTHFHLDHVLGLPSFEPFYKGQNDITIMGDPSRPDSWRRTLKTFMGTPYWPVGLGETAARMDLVDLPTEKRSMKINGVSVAWMPVPHPQLCLSYRVNMFRNTVVIATDVEYVENEISPEFIEFCHAADFLVFDAHFTPAEYPMHRGWGHSTWKVGAQVAMEAGVKNLILTHHAPTRTDLELDEIVRAAREVFPNTRVASENMLLATA